MACRFPRRVDAGAAPRGWAWADTAALQRQQWLWWALLLPALVSVLAVALQWHAGQPAWPLEDLLCVAAGMALGRGLSGHAAPWAVAVLAAGPAVGAELMSLLCLQLSRPGCLRSWDIKVSASLGLAVGALLILKMAPDARAVPAGTDGQGGPDGQGEPAGQPDGRGGPADQAAPASADAPWQLAQELHDGVGSLLLSASLLLRCTDGLAVAQARSLVDQALLELRSLLDVLTVEEGCAADEVDDGPLSTLLGNLRARLAPAFAATGCELQWQCEPLPKQWLPQRSQRLQLLRLLQEALANVLKHAQASQASVQALTAPGAGGTELHVTVWDNGRGMDASAQDGLGLRSMQERARALGATLSIQSQPGAGTHVKLVWPGR